ncbi:MAG TPA: hypothetical protein VF837_02985 [Patescibacteria group bacterium]
MDKIFKIAGSREEIQGWILKHHGRPAIIDDPEVGGDKIGLRIDFPGEMDEEMLSSQRDVTRDIDWDRFFGVMDSKNLVFEYLDEENLHNPSMSYRFLDKNNPQVDENGDLSEFV